MSTPVLKPADRGRIIEVARLRLNLPRAELVGELQPFWPDEFDGLWALRLMDGDRVILVMTEGEEVVAHAGFDRAAWWLQKIHLLDRPAPHTTKSVRPILDAVGGLSPAFPSEPDESYEPLADGGIRVIFNEPADWVQFAATGAQSIPPTSFITGVSGVRAPTPMGQMICEIEPSYRLSWRYIVDGKEIGGSSGHPLHGSPADDTVPALTSERALYTARQKINRPWAILLGPVRAVQDDSGPAWDVDLIGSKTIRVLQSELPVI